MRKTLVLFTFLLLSIGSWAQKTRDMSHEGSSGDVFIGYSLLNGDTLSHGSGWEAALTGNLNDWFGLKADLGGNYKSVGGVCGARIQHSFRAAALAPCGQIHRFCPRTIGRVASAGADVGPSSTGAGWVIGGGADYNLELQFCHPPGPAGLSRRTSIFRHSERRPIFRGSRLSI